MWEFERFSDPKMDWKLFAKIWFRGKPVLAGLAEPTVGDLARGFPAFSFVATWLFRIKICKNTVHE